MCALQHDDVADGCAVGAGTAVRVGSRSADAADDVHFGEIAGVAVNSKGHVFVFSRGNSTGPSYMATAAQLLEFDQKGKFVREIGKNLYAWSYAHAVRIDKDDNIWVVDKGSDMILKFNPQGRVVWVFGRKGEASHFMTPPDYASHAVRPAQPRRRRVTRAGEQQPAQPGAGASRQRLQPADRRRVGLEGQLVLHRRLRQLARRQGERARRVGGQLGLARQRPRAVRHAARHRGVAEGRGLRRRSRQPPHPGVRHRGQVPPAVHHRRAGRRDDAARSSTAAETPDAKTGSQAPGAPDALCMTPGPNPVLFVGDLYPSRIYKVSLEGKVLGVYGQPGRNLGEFGWIHAIACPSENEIWVGELINWRVQKLVTKGARTH